MKCFIPLAALVAFVSCSSENAPPKQAAKSTTDVVLASVGTVSITLEQFRTFSEAIPDGMKKGADKFAKERQVLESLIDKELLLLEARSLPLDENAEFQDELGMYSRNRLLELYTRRVVTEQIDISDEEMEAHYRATNRDRALRFNGIMLESEEEALAILQQIQDGSDFMELAKGYSLHRESAEQGGDVGGYKLKDKVHASIAEPIFALEVGQVTKPISLTFSGKPHYALFQVSDEMPVPMAASERKIREEIFGRKRAERYLVVLDSLKTAYSPQVQQAQIRWLNEHAQQEEMDPFTPPSEWANRPICTLREGQVSLAEFLQVGRQLRVSQAELADSARVDYILREVVLPAHLFADQAKAMGLDQNEELLARNQNKRDDLLLNALRQNYVDVHVEASDEEARAFYDANPKKFTSPITSEIIEVLVQSDTLAQRLKQRMAAGEDSEAIARQHTIRHGAAHHDGLLTVSVYTKAYYKDIFDAVQEAEVGQLVGPLRVPEGYSVFKVLDRHQKLASYDAESRRRAMAYVKIDKSKRGYVAYVRSLRDKYGVEVNEDAVKDALSTAL